MPDGSDEQHTTDSSIGASATKTTGKEVTSEKLCEVVNASTLRKTKVSVVENFRNNKVHEPIFDVYPQMRKVEDYFGGGYAGLEDVEIKNKTRLFRRQRKTIVKNQMRKEIGFHRKRPNGKDGIVKVEQLMESVTHKIELPPDQETPITAIVASAGSGKTTLMKRMARACVENCIGKPDDKKSPLCPGTSHLKMIHFMEAKNVKFEERTDVASFLFGGLYRDKDDEKKAYEWLIDHQSEAVLFIDGLDQAAWISSSSEREVSSFADCNSAEIMYNLLSRKLLPQLKIVIASPRRARLYLDPTWI